MTSNYCHLSTIFLTKKLQHPGLTFTAVQWASATPLGLVALGLSTTWCTGSSELYLGICNTWNTFSACNLVSEVLPVFAMVAEERLPLCWKSCKNIFDVKCFPKQYSVVKKAGDWRKNIWRSCNLDYVLQNILLSRQTRAWWPLVKDGNLRRIPFKVTRQCSSTSQGLIIYTSVPRPTFRRSDSMGSS